MRRLVLVAALALVAISLGAGGTPIRAQPTATITLPSPGGTVQLFPGCNAVPLTFPEGTSTETVVQAVTPAGVVESVWRHNAAERKWEGYSPAFPEVGDLLTVSFLDAVWICIGAAPSPPEPSAPPAMSCTPARPHDAGNFEETLVSGGREREYILHVPPSYTGADALPLVLNLHGHGSNAWEQALYSGLPRKADEAGFIVVTPQGTGTEPHWNFLGIGDSDVDDLAFIDDLLDTLTSELCIDQARVYSAGISNGAAMSVTLACRLSDRVSAIAPVAGLFFITGCAADRPVPVIAFHGTDDALVPFEGGMVAGSSLPVRATEESLQDWARHNGCAEDPERTRVSDSIRLIRYQGCDQDATVELYVIEGGGHTWPGAFDVPWLGATTHEISATDLMWAFFDAHPMP
jgi:polyhydroxybutyrate depolymerase